MERARHAGTKSCLDANLRVQLWPMSRARAILREAIAQCDVFLPGLDDMASMTGLEQPDAILDWVRTINDRAIVVLKMGSRGVILDDNVTRASIAPRNVRAVDATGAGDCFAGNLLARACAGDDWLAACHYANAAAGLSTTGYGAVDPLPRPEDVKTFLAT